MSHFSSPHFEIFLQRLAAVTNACSVKDGPLQPTAKNALSRLTADFALYQNADDALMQTQDYAIGTYLYHFFQSRQLDQLTSDHIANLKVQGRGSSCFGLHIDAPGHESFIRFDYTDKARTHFICGINALDHFVYESDTPLRLETLPVITPADNFQTKELLTVHRRNALCSFNRMLIDSMDMLRADGTISPSFRSLDHMQGRAKLDDYGLRFFRRAGEQWQALPYAACENITHQDDQCLLNGVEIMAVPFMFDTDKFSCGQSLDIQAQFLENLLSSDLQDMGTPDLPVADKRTMIACYLAFHAAGGHNVPQPQN